MKNIDRIMYYTKDEMVEFLSNLLSKSCDWCNRSRNNHCDGKCNLGIREWLQADIELSPCPFCGGEASVIPSSLTDGGKKVK